MARCDINLRGAYVFVCAILYVRFIISWPHFQAWLQRLERHVIGPQAF
jgi:hypothetical protein